MAKFMGKYRSESHRLKNWDYGSNALYFVTICTKNREHFFGNIIDKKMKLSELGIIAENFWNEIPKHFPFVELHNHIIMPNHIHGIIEIGVDADIADAPIVHTPNLGVYTGVSTAAASEKWKLGTLGVIINQYKRICTIHMRKINPNFAWQRNYHDHIIRNQQSYENIANYIDNNPAKWNEDKFYFTN